MEIYKNKNYNFKGNVFCRIVQNNLIMVVNYVKNEDQNFSDIVEMFKSEITNALNIRKVHIYVNFNQEYGKLFLYKNDLLSFFDTVFKSYNDIKELNTVFESKVKKFIIHFYEKPNINFFKINIFHYLNSYGINDCDVLFERNVNVYTCGALHKTYFCIGYKYIDKIVDNKDTKVMQILFQYIQTEERAVPKDFNALQANNLMTISITKNGNRIVERVNRKEKEKKKYLVGSLIDTTEENQFKVINLQWIDAYDEVMAKKEYATKNKNDIQAHILGTKQDKHFVILSEKLNKIIEKDKNISIIGEK